MNNASPRHRIRRPIQIRHIQYLSHSYLRLSETDTILYTKMLDNVLCFMLFECAPIFAFYTKLMHYLLADN